jgi:hypothetical protein
MSECHVPYLEKKRRKKVSSKIYLSRRLKLITLKLLSKRDVQICIK